MSRIGKKPVDIPSGVDIKIVGDNITVKGPRGELSCNIPPLTKVSLVDKQIVVERIEDTNRGRAMHGLTRNLLSNMVTGVTSGYQKVMDITGVGYRAQVQGNKILFSLGYSHPIEFALPPGISATVDQKQTQLTISGIDKQKLGQVAADLRRLRKPDAYKGKGIRYAGQRLKLKAGKTGKK